MLICSNEEGDEGSAEIWQIVRASTGYMIAVDDDRSILPFSTGVDKVIFDAWRPGDPNAAINTG
jgi:hypothetical protein